MQFPSMPSEDNVKQYVNWHCIHHLSNKMYHDWVMSEQGKESAVSRCLHALCSVFYAT